VISVKLLFFFSIETERNENKGEGGCLIEERTHDTLKSGHSNDTEESREKEFATLPN